MDEKTKATLTNLDTWKRGLFMVVFSMISGVAKLLVTIVAIFQFITLLFKGRVNESVIPFGQNLSTYLYQTTLFLTFKTDEMPFPFLDFPNGTPRSERSENNKENNKENIVPTDEAMAKNDQKVVEAVNEDTKDETEAEKDTKDAPFKG
jgi:hypothetical protein